MTYEVGQFYNVPCVRGAWGTDSRVRDWPVMGALHEDGDIIGFKWKHYHIDWRFVARPHDSLSLREGADGHTTTAQHRYARPLMVWDRMNYLGLPAPVLRRRKCVRAHTLPFDARPIKWLPKLEAAHADCKMVGRICPHRGYDLSHEPVDENGVVTCPCHGLRWNVFTGALAPRQPVQISLLAVNNSIDKEGK